MHSKPVDQIKQQLNQSYNTTDKSKSKDVSVRKNNIHSELQIRELRSKSVARNNFTNQDDSRNTKAQQMFDQNLSSYIDHAEEIRVLQDS